jgi:transposase
MLGKSTNREGVCDFFQLLRNAFPRNLRGESIVVVLDNHTAHKTAKVVALTLRLGIELMFLPPYRP